MWGRPSQKYINRSRRIRWSWRLEKKVFRLDSFILWMSSWKSTSKCRSEFVSVDSLKRPSEVNASMASVQVESNLLNTEWNKNGSMISTVGVASVWGQSREPEGWYCNVWQHFSLFQQIHVRFLLSARNCARPCTKILSKQPHGYCDFQKYKLSCPSGNVLQNKRWRTW